MFQTPRNLMAPVRTRYRVGKWSNWNIRRVKIPIIVSCRAVCSPIVSIPVSLHAEFNFESHAMSHFVVWFVSYRPKSEISIIFRKAVAPNRNFANHGSLREICSESKSPSFSPSRFLVDQLGRIFKNVTNRRSRWEVSNASLYIGSATKPHDENLSPLRNKLKKFQLEKFHP